MFSHPCGSSVQPRQLLHPDTVLLKLYSRSPLPCPLPNLPRSFKSVLLPSKPRAGELETAPPPHAFPPVLLSPVLRRPDHLERGLRVISPSGLQRRAGEATSVSLDYAPFSYCPVLEPHNVRVGATVATRCALAAFLKASLRKSPRKGWNLSGPEPCPLLCRPPSLQGNATASAVLSLRARLCPS